MTLNIELPVDIETNLMAEARRQGATPETLVLNSLRQSFPLQENSTGALEHILAQFEAEEDPRSHYDRTTDAYRNSPIDVALVDKFQKQGLHLS